MQVLMLRFFILTIVITLIFADFLIAHNTIAIAAFAKKKSSDNADGIAADASNSLRPEASFCVYIIKKNVITKKLMHKSQNKQSGQEEEKQEYPDNNKTILMHGVTMNMI